MNDDCLHEECGVFGIYAPGQQVAQLTCVGLHALQHRGQASAGIATTDGRRINSHRGLGLVAQVFSEATLTPLLGHSAVGHTRYATTGGATLANAQPLVRETYLGPLAIAHNGNLTNTEWLRQDLLRRGVALSATTDSELALLTLLASGASDMADCVQHFVALAQGAYCLVILTTHGLYAMRDPLGFRPLCLGRLDDTGWVVASESCALDAVGATWLREIAPGELVRIDAHGPSTLASFPAPRAAFCAFEYVYFARPDSILQGQSVHQTRRTLGMQLAREAPAEADIVIGVPESALPAALGYAAQSGIPYAEGLVKNRYVGRSFIQPTQQQREQAVRLKFAGLPSTLAGQRVVLVDDSLVRGTTSQAIVALLRQAGAREVHLRIAAPPIRHPCFMGVDMSSYDELIAHQLDPEGIRAMLNVESLGYLSLEGLRHASGHQHGGLCGACFNGDYPIAVPLPTLDEVITLTPTPRVPARHACPPARR